MTPIDFELRGEHIALDALLKATGLAPSGGTAKALVADGRVTVDGAVERRKTCKIRAGQRVAFGAATVRVGRGHPIAGEPAPTLTGSDQANSTAAPTRTSADTDA